MPTLLPFPILLSLLFHLTPFSIDRLIIVSTISIGICSDTDIIGSVLLKAKRCFLSIYHSYLCPLQSFSLSRILDNIPFSPCRLFHVSFTFPFFNAETFFISLYPVFAGALISSSSSMLTLYSVFAALADADGNGVALVFVSSDADGVGEPPGCFGAGVSVAGWSGFGVTLLSPVDTFQTDNNCRLM